MTAGPRTQDAAMPTLSICIPTFNRLSFLRECLASVDSMARPAGLSLEIVISDNGSTDGTRDFLTGLDSSVTSRRVLLQTVNIGAERNFRALAKAATGRFIWILGDDDLVEADGLTLIFERIAQGASTVVCNYSVWDRQMRSIVAAHGLKGATDASFFNSDRVMSRFGLNLGYISSVVMRRDLFLLVTDAEYEQFTSYGFPFMYAAFVGLKKECHLAFVQTPLVRNRAGNSGDYDWYRYFVTGSCLIFERLAVEHGYSRLAIAVAKNRSLLQYVLRQVLSARLKQGARPRVGRLLWDNYRHLPMYWLGVLPALFVPRTLLSLTVSWAKRARRAMSRQERTPA